MVINSDDLMTTIAADTHLQMSEQKWLQEKRKEKKMITSHIQKGFWI